MSAHAEAAQATSELLGVLALWVVVLVAFAVWAIVQHRRSLARRRATWRNSDAARWLAEPRSLILPRPKLYDHETEDR